MSDDKDQKDTKSEDNKIVTHEQFLKHKLDRIFADAMHDSSVKTGGHPEDILSYEVLSRLLKHLSMEEIQKVADKHFLNGQDKQLSIQDQAILRAAQEQDSLFFEGMPKQDLQGNAMKVIRGDQHYQLLEATQNDNLARVFTLLNTCHYKSLNTAWFWEFESTAAPDKPEICFLTPAHLLRSYEMALTLQNHKLDIRQPTSDGHLPMYFWAQNVRDPYLLSWAVTVQKLDPNFSGRNTINGEDYPFPLWMAVAANNKTAIKAFCDPALKTDLNKTYTTQRITPLMHAVMKADEDIATFYADKSIIDKKLPFRIQKRLWAVYKLASCPALEPEQKDMTGWRAEDYAHHPAVRSALKKGLAQRDTAMKNAPEYKYRSRQQPPRPR